MYKKRILICLIIKYCIYIFINPIIYVIANDNDKKILIIGSYSTK